MVEHDGEDGKVAQISDKDDKSTNPEDDAGEICGRYKDCVFYLPHKADLNISISCALFV